MNTMYGLRIMSLLPNTPDRVVWLSINPAKVAEERLKIQAEHPPGTVLFKQVESDIIVGPEGWYHMGPRFFLKVHKKDSFQCFGHVYRLSEDGRVRNMRRAGIWCLNGEPLKQLPYKITAKVDGNESPRKYIWQLGELLPTKINTYRDYHGAKDSAGNTDATVRSEAEPGAPFATGGIPQG